MGIPRSHRTRLPALALLAGALLLALLAVACSSGQASPSSPSSSLTPLSTATPMPATPTAQPPTAVPTVATPTSTSSAVPSGGPPAQGRWIDVNLTSFRVSLMDGTQALQVIGPVAVGAQIDTGNYNSTETGLFHVYSMNEALTYDAPYHTYISDWVGFDPKLANGLHSFLKNASGQVVDASTGRVSNGCIRTPDPQAIYDFAHIGMPVYVHR